MCLTNDSSIVVTSYCPVQSAGCCQCSRPDCPSMGYPGVPDHIILYDGRGQGS